jgi:hypothetical protein
VKAILQEMRRVCAAEAPAAAPRSRGFGGS